MPQFPPIPPADYQLLMDLPTANDGTKTTGGVLSVATSKAASVGHDA